MTEFSSPSSSSLRKGAMATRKIVKPKGVDADDTETRVAAELLNLEVSLRNVWIILLWTG